jgi:hypothetical protein
VGAVRDEGGGKRVNGDEEGVRNTSRARRFVWYICTRTDKDVSTPRRSGRATMTPEW